MRGSPIRTPSDQRSVGSSPRLNAASHVLHRLLMPRHPPCALHNLTHNKPTPTHRPATSKEGHPGGWCDQQTKQRCSRPLCSSQPTTRNHPTHPRQPHPHRTTAKRGGPSRRVGGTRNRAAGQRSQPPTPAGTHRSGQGGGPLSQDPTACRHPPPEHPRRDPHPHPATRNGGRGGGGTGTSGRTSRQCVRRAFHP